MWSCSLAHVSALLSVQDSIQMTGATAPGGRAAHSPDRAASRGRYAGEPASSPEVSTTALHTDTA